MLKNNDFYDNQKEEVSGDADHVRACAQRALCGSCVPMQCLWLLSLFCNFMQSCICILTILYFVKLIWTQLKLYCFFICEYFSFRVYLFVPCFRLQLQTPGHYSPLEAFYEDKRALLPSSGDGVITACPANAWGAVINHSMHPEMKVAKIYPITATKV